MSGISTECRVPAADCGTSVRVDPGEATGSATPSSASPGEGVAGLGLAEGPLAAFVDANAGAAVGDPAAPFTGALAAEAFPGVVVPEEAPGDAVVALRSVAVVRAAGAAGRGKATAGS